MNSKKDSAVRARLVEGVQNMIRDSGLTYFTIAHRVGVPTNVIASYMGKNSRLPSLETLAVLCRELHASADEVMGLREGRKNP